MRFHRIAVMAAALSMTGAAIAAGSNAVTSPSSSRDRSAQQSQAGVDSAMAPGAATGTSAGAATAEQHDPAVVRSVQQALKDKGYNAGAIDGQWGHSTESALKSFQQAQGLPQSGGLDQQTLAALGVDSSQAATSGSSSSTPGAMPGGTPNTMQSPGSMQDKGMSSPSYK